MSSQRFEVEYLNSEEQMRTQIVEIQDGTRIDGTTFALRLASLDRRFRRVRRYRIQGSKAWTVVPKM